MVLALLTAACGGGTDPGLVLTHNGRLADYAFDKAAPISTLTPAFRLGGTATSRHATVSLRSSGLYVHVDQHQPGTWLGYYEATAATFPANSVIHVRMWRPQRSVPLATESGIALLAVQTGASKDWDSDVIAPETKVLSDMPSPTTSEDITLKTNGSSQFSVYFGDKLVYESKSLKLGVAPPLRVYLEVEARGMAYITRFQHFWVSAGTSVRVAGLQPGYHVSLTPDGDATIHAVANSTGQARLQLPLTEAVGKGTLKIDGPHLRRQFKNVAFAGGDVYKFTS